MTNAMVAELNHEEFEESLNQYVTFFIGKERYAFPMTDVVEIIRIPSMVDVPLTSSSLLGLANLRGHVLPVLDLRTILSFNSVEQTESSRILVVNVGTNIGLMVDRVSRVIDVTESDIQDAQGIKSSINAELLQGVINGGDDQGFIQILLPKQCVETQFQNIISDAVQSNSMADGSTASITIEEEEADEDIDMLVSFNVDEQEYAFHLGSVQEIVRLPDDISQVPHVDSHVLGLINLRGRVLPLISLRSLFGMYEGEVNEDHRILVVDLNEKPSQSSCVGLVVDGVKEVLRVSPNEQGEVPKLLNTFNSDDIEKICRLNNGKRLVSVLKPSSLLQYPSVQKAFDEAHQEDQTMEQQQDNDLDLDSDNEQMVVFKLADQEYGISIEDVQEITRVPEKLDKVPKTASFIDGMVNLRGTILPVVDMRTRFDMDRIEASDRQRILVVNIDSVKTGFVVDSVSEVLRLSKRQIEDAPPLSDDQNRMLGKVVNLSQRNRIIQILSARELLSANEQTIVADQLG